MSTRQVIILGTASLTPIKARAHNGYIIRWDDKTFLFDPGEGTQRQFIFAGSSIAKLSAVFITHFHGDHCLGLPGIIQRRSLDNSHNNLNEKFPIYYPLKGENYFQNLKYASIYKENAFLDTNPISNNGQVGSIGSIDIFAHELKHRTTTYGYVLREKPRIKFIPEKLDEFGIKGPSVKELHANGSISHNNKNILLEDVSYVQKGQSAAFIMDTAYDESIIDFVKDVDVLICESTYADSEKELAKQYLHLTSTQAATIAKKANVNKLILTHFSARYRKVSLLEKEARKIHENTIAARDLDVINFPTRNQPTTSD